MIAAFSIQVSSVLRRFAVIVLFVASPVPAMAQAFSSVEAINRCEAFVESALRPEYKPAFAEPYKVSCYFGLTDPLIHEDLEGVCDKVSRAFSSPYSDIARFICLGTYRAYLAEGDSAAREP